MVTKILKRLVLYAFTIICLAASCDPEETIMMRFYVKNSTNDTIQISASYRLNGYSYVSHHNMLPVNKDSTVLINVGTASEDNNIDLFAGLFNWNVIDDTLSIFDKDSVLKKQWTRFYNVNEQNKQFFRESDWTYRQYEDPSGEYEYIHEWTFEITYADLQ